MKNTTLGLLQAGVAVLIIASAALYTPISHGLVASSHREAPLILADPLADNTDVYAFRSPDDTNRVTIIADYIPFQKADGGPNYYSFGEDIRYEIHIKNNAATAGDDITYRFTFNHVNQDSTTFFNIRLAKQNLKTTYTLERKIGANPFAAIITDGVVPPNNIGPRSINSAVGLNTTYDALVTSAIEEATTGEVVFAGPRDDPFFVDLGAIFDLGAVRQPGRDGLYRNNIHSIVMKVPINILQKDGKTAAQKTSILDPDFVIGVWASASRPQIKTLSPGRETSTGNYVQVSRLGMPLTNEAVNPIGYKDRWNSQDAYGEDTEDTSQINYFANPELALYMDDSAFGPAVPGLAPLRIQTHSLRGLLPGFPGFDFRNGRNGVAAIRGSNLLDSTALAESAFGGYLLRRGQPRRVDLLPIFHTGVPNLRPYQLATGKAGGNPLKAGKPFINNFLPTFGDMLRLNMAVPPTPRNSADFSSEGLIAAAVLGLTDARFNTTKALQFIPNMDGFPNGRRLEDDVTRIELQAVGGAVLAAIGLWYDDYTVGTTTSPLTPRLLGTLGFNTGVTGNDTTYRSAFPYVQTPWRGYENGGKPYREVVTSTHSALALATDKNAAYSFPNPFVRSTTIRYNLVSAGSVSVKIYDVSGRLVQTLTDADAKPGINNLEWQPARAHRGTYFGQIMLNGKPFGTVKMVVAE